MQAILLYVGMQNQHKFKERKRISDEEANPELTEVLRRSTNRVVVELTLEFCKLVRKVRMILSTGLKAS